MLLGGARRGMHTEVFEDAAMLPDTGFNGKTASTYGRSTSCPTLRPARPRSCDCCSNNALLVCISG